MVLQASEIVLRLQNFHSLLQTLFKKIPHSKSPNHLNFITEISQFAREPKLGGCQQISASKLRVHDTSHLTTVSRRHTLLPFLIPEDVKL